MKHILLALLLIFLSENTFANIWDEHLKPTLEEGFDSTGLTILAAGSLAIALAQPNDYHVREEFSQHRKMSESTADIGDFLGSGVPGSLIALTQLFYDHENGYAHAEALIDSLIVTSILKQADFRARPNSDDHHSMPSGHTSTTFTTATALTYAYGWKAAVPAYALAAFTAASRWSDDAHWFSDTVAGSVVGIFWGRATSFHHQKQGQVASFRAWPVASHDFLGGAIFYEF